jgi:hypothetical protein
MKTFKEFLEELYLTEKTFSTRQQAVDYHKENPPYGDEPYHIRRKNRRGEPESWRPVRARQRNQQSSTRRKNSNPLSRSEIADFLKRNLHPNPEKTAIELMKKERNRKSSQNKKARSETEKTGELHTIDHPQPVSQDRRNPELRQRFQNVVPGDTSYNREVMQDRENASKNSKPPKRGESGFGRTRSGAIRSLMSCREFLQKLYLMESKTTERLFRKSAELMNKHRDNPDKREIYKTLLKRARERLKDKSPYDYPGRESARKDKVLIPSGRTSSFPELSGISTITKNPKKLRKQRALKEL